MEYLSAYDINYSLNPLMNCTRTDRALSINGKRIDITLASVLTIAETCTIKNTILFTLKFDLQLFK